MNDVVIFDGACRFCAGSVNFILRHEARPTLRFAPLQSSAGTRLLRQYRFDPEDVRTFVVITDGMALSKSAAALQVCRHLRGVWQLTRMLWIVPRPIRDYAYDVIARNRYRWFGRLASCMMPTPELAARFLDE